MSVGICNGSCRCLACWERTNSGACAISRAFIHEVNAALATSFRNGCALKREANRATGISLALIKVNILWDVQYVLLIARSFSTIAMEVGNKQCATWVFRASISVFASSPRQTGKTAAPDISPSRVPFVSVDAFHKAIFTNIRLYLHRCIKRIRLTHLLVDAGVERFYFVPCESVSTAS